MVDSSGNENNEIHDSFDKKINFQTYKCVSVDYDRKYTFYDVKKDHWDNGLEKL